MIISLGSAASQPSIRLITFNYGAGRVDYCSPDEVSHDELSSDELSPIKCRTIKCHGTYKTLMLPKIYL